MPSEHLIFYRTTSQNPLLGQPSQLGSSAGVGTDATTRAWRSTLKRMTARKQLTGTGSFAVFTGIAAHHDPAAFFPLMAPNNLIYRIRAGIAAEYVIGGLVSRVGWGMMKSWSDQLIGAPGAPLDLGFIGFLWYQVGSTSVNWRAVAANHAGDNKFDKDLGKVAPDVPYNMRIDFDGRVGQRKIVWFLDEVEVASFTPADDALGGTSTLAMRMGIGVNVAAGNVCAAHYEMLGQVGWELVVAEGGPTT